MNPHLRQLYSGEFEERLHRKLWTFAESIRGPAILFAIDKVATSIREGRLVPDPELSLLNFVGQKARWKALGLLRKSPHTSSALDALAAPEGVPVLDDAERAAVFAAVFGLPPRQRMALMSEEEEPWLHQVEMFLNEDPSADQPAVAEFAGFPVGSSFPMAKNRARTAVRQAVDELLSDPASFAEALGTALKVADAELVSDVQFLTESPLSCLAAEFAAAAVDEAVNRGIEIPIALATEVALRLDVGNRSDLALALLERILPLASSPVLESQAAVARAIVLDHQATHEHGERRYESACMLLTEAIDSAADLLSTGMPLPDHASWWIKYQLALLRRRLLEVRRDQCGAQHPGEPFDQGDLERSLDKILLLFEMLLQTARNVSQRLAVMHQSAVVRSLLADLQRANDPVAARKGYETVEQRLRLARWLAVAHGENQGRRFVYGFRRMGLVLSSLADLAESPKDKDSLRWQSFDELKHAMNLAGKHDFLRLQAQISRDIARLFPIDFEHRDSAEYRT